MNKVRIASATVIFLALATAAFSQGHSSKWVGLPDTIKVNRTLYADSIYQLVNTTIVPDGVTLTIQPGTLILGNKTGTRSCLQVERGGKLYAVGTAKAPIVFTSDQPQGSKNAGDWGGIILLGKARVNTVSGTATIEGGTNGVYGGTDDDDSSGVLQYLRIEYAGIAFAPNQEINSLTMGGVGRKTKISHIMSSYGNDDSFEWFGGTVNATNLIAFAGLDDEFDTDYGFTGRLQFLFGMRDSAQRDVSTSNGMEADNDGTGTLSTPRSHPRISNLTLVGPTNDTTNVPNSLFGRGGHWRRSTRYGLFNSVITGYQEGLRIDGGNGDLDSVFVGGADCPQPANFRIRNTVITGKLSEVRGVSGTSQTLTDSWFNCSSMGNVRGGNHSGAGLLAVSQADLNNPDPRPSGISPAATGSDFTDAQLAAGNNFTFATTSYKGAFDPNASRKAQWDSVWANYNPKKTTFVKHRTGWNLVAIANTPANNHKDSIYHNTVSNAFSFSGGYVVDNTMDAGKGYFMKLGDNSIVEQVGAPITTTQVVNVVNGWNLVSTGMSVVVDAATAGNVVFGGGAASASNFFGFNNGYSTETKLEPGKAYWVKSNGAGTITFNP